MFMSIQCPLVKCSLTPCRKTCACWAWQRRQGRGMISGRRHGEGEVYDYEGTVWVRGIRRSQSWKQMWFQLPPKRNNIFCSVKRVWQPVPAGLLLFQRCCFSSVKRPHSTHWRLLHSGVVDEGVFCYSVTGIVSSGFMYLDEQRCAPVRGFMNRQRERHWKEIPQNRVKNVEFWKAQSRTFNEC